jgi:hypothetical protein
MYTGDSMKILIIDDTPMTIGTAIANVLKNSTEVDEVVMGGYPLENEHPSIKVFPYERCYPASSKYVREKDWVQPRSKNQYKQRRKGR